MNVTSRIIDLAEAGDVLTTDETMQQVDADEIGWERVGQAELKGVATPVTLYRASRRGSSERGGER